MPLSRFIVPLVVAIAMATAFASAPLPSLANNPSCCFGNYITPICSPLDTPLRYYFIPRRPAFAPHDYCYRVRGLRPCPDCCNTAASVPPQLAENFEPWEFERLGNIPGDPLLEAAASAGR